jgi:hypothetical protein
MRKNYSYQNIDEMHIGSFSGKPCLRFSYEHKLLQITDEQLMRNFCKVAEWIGENCPNLNGEFHCKHDPFHWTKLVVEGGKAYLETGSHGWGFEIALSTTETATFSRGSSQSNPYAFFGVRFFRNERLEEFLSQWLDIKQKVVAKNNIQRNVFSDTFTA